MDKHISENQIDMSMIIPVYNVEDYLPACIDSVICQEGLHLEIILINDGSTDRSGSIADRYACQDSRIKVIHQENRGLSAARNAGLELAQGEYIAFVDSDDWIKENSLCELYREATRQQADMVMGNMKYSRQDGSTYYPFDPVPEEIRHIPLSGKEGFIRLIKANAYTPMVCNYIYRRSYLVKMQFRFEDGIIHEDELWTPVVLCQAGTVVVVDVDFYYYRQREGSIMDSSNLDERLNALFRITDRLIEFAGQFEFSGADGELKSWLYVNIYRLYSKTFMLLSRIKNSSMMVPAYQLDRFWRDGCDMMPEPQRICNHYFRIAEAGLKKYTDWRTSGWVASIAPQIKAGKKLMLVYNTIWGEELSLKVMDVPAGWIITTDRRYYQQADAVVFHLPDLRQELDYDLDKQPGQIWIGWYLESEENYPWIRSPEFRVTFDLWMSYRQDADVVYPYYRHEYSEVFSQQIPLNLKQNKTCMFVSNPVNKSGRMEYLKELMKYTGIDSYGKLFNNKLLHLDRGEETKLDICRNYKFVIAFENSIDIDYVTEKFFDPFIAGSVPVYFGAPNIKDYAPGDNCFLDVRQFENPQALSDFINTCYNDEQLYSTFFKWKNQPLCQAFLQKVIEQKEHPLVRLCRKVEELLVRK